MNFLDFTDSQPSHTLFLEDLKSDDNNIRVHAISRLNSVAELLGSNTTTQIIIPALVDLVEAKAIPDEILPQLIEQLEPLIDNLSEDDLPMILQLLELLAASNDIKVRSSATDILITKVLIREDQEFQVNIVLKLIKRLAQDLSSAARESSCSLLAAIYPYVPEDNCLEIVQLYHELSADAYVEVRRALGNNLNQIIKNMESENARQEVVPIFNNLLKDEHDTVQITALDQSEYILKLYNEEEVPDVVIGILKVVDGKNKSWRTLYAIANSLVKYCPYLDKMVIEGEIFQFYKKFLSESEPEIRQCAVEKLPMLLEYLSQEAINEVLIQYSEKLAKDESMHVRLTFAENIDKLSLLTHSEEALRGLIEAMVTLLNDDIIEVRVTTAKQVQQNFAKIKKDLWLREIVNVVGSIAKSKQWRCRASIIDALPDIAINMGEENFRIHLVQIYGNFIEDHYAAIRESTIDSLCKLVQGFGEQIMLEYIKGYVNKLINYNNYLFRISGIYFLLKLKGYLNEYSFEELLFTAVEKLKNDKVANVRLNLAQNLPDIVGGLNNELIQEKIVPILNKFMDDEDFDVSYFAKKSLSRL